MLQQIPSQAQLKPPHQRDKQTKQKHIYIYGATNTHHSLSLSTYTYMYLLYMFICMCTCIYTQIQKIFVSKSAEPTCISSIQPPVRTEGPSWPLPWWPRLRGSASAGSWSGGYTRRGRVWASNFGALPCHLLLGFVVFQVWALIWDVVHSGYIRIPHT